VAAGERPWWRDWRGMPPSWDRRRTDPLGPVRVWVIRMIWLTLLVGGAIGMAQGWSIGPSWLAMFVAVIALTPAPQRRQILGLRPRAT